MQEASIAFQAGKRYEIGTFTLECLEVRRETCYVESKVALRQRVSICIYFFSLFFLAEGPGILLS